MSLAQPVGQWVVETVAGGYPGGWASGETMQSEPRRGRPRGRLVLLDPHSPWGSFTSGPGAHTSVAQPYPDEAPTSPHSWGGSGLDITLNSSTSLASCGLLPPGIPWPLGHPDPGRKLSNRHQNWPRCLKAVSSPAGPSLARALSSWLRSRPGSYSPLDTGSNSSPYSGLAQSQARS